MHRIYTSFTEISKAFDCVDHNLLITKLSWYEITLESLNIIFFYLSNRAQGFTINNSFSGKSGVRYVVPQGSLLGSLLFNIDLIGLFFECENDNIATLMTLLPIPGHKIYHL